MTRTSLLALACLALSTTAALGQGSFDVVVTYEGAPKRGKITDLSKDAVGIEITGGIASKVELFNVKQVVFANAPTPLRAAQTAMASGQFDDALDKLKQVNKDDVSDMIWDEVVYSAAFCMSKMALAGGGDKTVAGRAMGVFANAEKNSYHYYEANEIMGDLVGSMGKPDIAATFYGKVGGAPWPEYKMKAAVLEGQALVAQGKFQDAYQKFNTVVSSTQATPLATRMKEFATLGRAVCLSEAGKPDDAVADVEKIIANGDSRDGELFARAYNALGYCHTKANRPKDALLAYLHVDLMFSQDPAQHAEALYHLRDLWKGVNKTEQSLKARTLLKQRYPGSVWASKAE